MFIDEVTIEVHAGNGGDGCCRDVVEQVLKSQGKWMSHDAFGW